MGEISWHLITLKQYPVFGRFFMLESFRDVMPKTLGIGFKNFKSLYSGIYADAATFEQVKDLLIKKLENNPEEIDKIIKKWQLDCEKLIDFSQSFPDDLQKLSDDQLIKLIEQTVDHFKLTASYIFLHHGLAGYFETWLNNLLAENKLPKTKQKIYFQVLSTPTKNTGLVESSKQLENISKIGNKTDRAKAIKQYAKNFAWTGYDTGIGHNLTAEEASEQLKYISKLSPVQISRKAIFERLKLSKLDTQYLSIMDGLLYLGTFRAEAHMKAGVGFRRILEELASRLSADYDNLVQFTLPEIKNALSASNLLDSRLAEARKVKFGALMINGKISIHSGDEVDEIEEYVSLADHLQEITGMIACSGKAKGPAKIVITKADFAKVKNGDVIVSKMTGPEFITILNKCSGIITDIGGITCHAAIISRELNKPCLIGTEYATIFFKDGDLLELDAEKGVAKKL